MKERVSNKTAIAPTASISIICGGSSPGIEPIAANSYTHKTLSGSFNVRNKYLKKILQKYNKDTDEVWSTITTNQGSVSHLNFLSANEKDTFKTAFEIDQRWIVELGADRTPHISQAQSVNIFVPADIHKNSKFVVDVKSTGLYAKDKVLLENNCETIYWKTGHSHIKRKVNLEKALAGFEKSGHFFFNQPLGYGYDDGINSAIQVCHFLTNQNKKMSEIINELPKTYQSPTMAPFCKDEEKYKVVDEMIKKVEDLKKQNIKIDNQSITEVLTVNGVRFSLTDGSWGLIRASSNKPSLVVVTESPTSNERKKKIFDFIDKLLQGTGKIGEYDQKI